MYLHAISDLLVVVLFVDIQWTDGRRSTTRQGSSKKSLFSDSRYKIRVSTGDRKNAGTDAKVVAKFII